MKLYSIVTMLVLSIVSVNAVVTFIADPEQEWPSNPETGSKTIVFDFTVSGTGSATLALEFSDRLSKKPDLLYLDPTEGLKRVKHHGGGWGSKWRVPVNTRLHGTGIFAIRVDSPAPNFTVTITGSGVDSFSSMGVGGSVSRLGPLGLLESTGSRQPFRLENADGDAVRLPQTDRITVVDALPPFGEHHHIRMQFLTETPNIVVDNELGRLVSFTPTFNEPIPGNTAGLARLINDREKSERPELKPDIYISLFDSNFDSSSVIVKLERLTSVDRGFLPGIYTTFVPPFEGIQSVQGMHFMVVMVNENHQ